MEALFPMGKRVITARAQNVLHPEVVDACFHRHSRGDWGDLDSEDVAENQRALRDGLRLFSRYTDRDGRVLYVITESDRSVTTLLLPEDY